MNRLELRSRIKFIEELLPILEKIAGKDHRGVVDPYIAKYVLELNECKDALEFLTNKGIGK